MHLVLGTANLGQKYGISNAYEMSDDESVELIRFSHSQGIRSFDTAPDYGSAESLIKHANVVEKSDIQIKISKSTGSNIEKIKQSVLTSLGNLGTENVHTIFFHDPEIYNSANFSIIVDSLLDFGVTKKIGISCYTPEQAWEAFNRCKKLSAFQLPENILDRRLIENDTIKFMVELGCAIQVRSIFLQGLLLMNPEEIPSQLGMAKHQISKLAKFAEDKELSVLQLCLTYAMQLRWADSIVIGANSITQLTEILTASKISANFDWEKFEKIPEPWIDPRNWKGV